MAATSALNPNVVRKRLDRLVVQGRRRRKKFRLPKPFGTQFSTEFKIKKRKKKRK